MSLGFRSTGNILDNTTLAHGVKVSDVPGDGGAGPLGFVIIISASGLTPNQPSIEIDLLAPTTIAKSAMGTDENGNISVTVTWINFGNDLTFLQAGGGTADFTGGFWQFPIRGTLSVPSNELGIDIQFSTDAVISFNPDLTTAPDVPVPVDPLWDGSKGTVTLDINYNDSLVEDPDSIAITRDDVVIASIPVIPDTTDYSYIDTVFAAGTYVYKAFVYKYSNSRSALSAGISVDLGGVPSLELIMSGGFDMGGSMIFNFLADPSGIYKLTTGLLHDELYNRADPLDITTENVAIPDIFIDTFFDGR